MSAAPEAVLITATQIPGNRRSLMLPKHFGARMMHVESAIFDFAGELRPDYAGGLWEFHETSNGGFYMTNPEPNVGERQRIVTEGGFDEPVSTDAAGVIVCLFAYSHVSIGLNDQRIAEQYHLLLDYALGHPEAALITGACD